MLREEKRRKKEIEEQKQKRKEVREQKKKEKEARIEAERGRGRGHGRGRGRGKGKEKAAVVQSSESESDALSDVDMLIPRHTPTSSAGETSHKRGKGRWKGKQKATVQSSESDALSDESDALSDVDMLAPRHSPTSSNAGETSRPRRQWQIPSRFRCNCDSEENDGTICVLCEHNKGYQEALFSG